MRLLTGRGAWAATLAVLSAAALLLACAHDGDPARPASAQDWGTRITEGRRIAEINCSTCHAIGRWGDSRHPAAPPFRYLSRDYPVNELEEAFAEGIMVGHPDMPEFRLEPAEIDALLAYIQSVQERDIG